MVQPSMHEDIRQHFYNGAFLEGAQKPVRSSTALMSIEPTHYDQNYTPSQECLSVYPGNG